MPEQGRGLVQPIVVSPGGTHLQVITAVMSASLAALRAGHATRNGEFHGNWQEWMDGGFTKTVRAVKNASQFDAVCRLPNPKHYGMRNGCVHAAAFAPMRYEDFPKEIARARVAGLERPRDPLETIRRPHHVVMLNAALGMSTGKASAQAAHALMLWYVSYKDDGYRTSTTVSQFSAVEVDAGFFAETCAAAPEIAVRDAGFTELAPGTVTAVAAADSDTIRAMMPHVVSEQRRGR